MYELIQVAEHSYYIESPAKIGLIRLGENEVCLIDSGNDESAGRKVRQILEQRDWTLRAIYNTHSNADHIGGNRYLQRRSHCKIYAPGVECAMTRHPILEPSYLYGGYPPEKLRHKFLMAQASDAEYLSEDALPEGVEMIPLPGHFFDMVGFRSPDDIVYLADCLSSEETLEKYRIAVLYDVASYLKTLERAKEMKAAYFVPSHAEATDSIAPLAQINIDAVRAVSEDILRLCARPRMFEEILRELFNAYGLSLSLEQYVLVGSTVRSYLAWLSDTGALRHRVDDNRLIWERV